MDEQRIAAYIELIQALLSCPSGERAAILQANSLNKVSIVAQENNDEYQAINL